MAEGKLGAHYQHLKKEYLHYPLEEVVEKLINQMRVNELKSKSILRMEGKIQEIEAQYRAKGILLTHTKDPKLRQLKEAYEMRQTQKSQTKDRTPRDMDGDRGTPRRSTPGSQYKFRELNTTRTPEREDLLLSMSPHSPFLRDGTSEHIRVIAQLSLKNKSLLSQIQNLKQQFNLLNLTHEGILQEISILKMNQQVLMRENNQLTLDSRYRITQYQKSVGIIQKLLSQIQEFKGLHSQKSKVIKEITSTNQELEGDIHNYLVSVGEYEKKEQEYIQNEGEYEEEISRLRAIGAENDIIVERLEKQNEKLSEQLREEMNNTSLLEQVMQEMRERNHVLQKRIFMLEEEVKQASITAQQKEKEINRLLAKDSELTCATFQLKEENGRLKQEFIQSSQEFKEQINIQLKLISDYQRVQKPKQLIHLKDKFKGEDRHKEFKLNTFNQKLNGERSGDKNGEDKRVVRVEDSKHAQKEIERSVQQREQLHDQEQIQKSRRLKTTSEGLKGLVMSIENKMSQLMGTYDALNSKTSQLTKKIPASPRP